MTASIVLTAPGALSAPLPGTPILRLSGDVTVLAADSFTGVDGTLVHGRATTPPPGQTALTWASTAGARLSAGTMIQGDPSITGVTYVNIPASEPPATYEATVRVVSATAGSVYVDLFRSSDAAGGGADKFRLTIATGGAMRLSSTKSGAAVDLGPVMSWSAGDVLGVRAHPTSGTVEALKNGAVVQSHSGLPAQPGRGVGVACATGGEWAVDNFRLVQTLD